jgi:hypothetical protein
VLLEEQYFHAFTQMPELDFVTFDFYFPDAKGVAIRDQMVKWAHEAGKPVYIEETWRPHDLPSHMTGNVGGRPRMGEALFEPIDIKWMKAVSLYAATHGLEAVTFFYSTAFFAYTPSSTPETATAAYYARGAEARYDQAVDDALMKGERTDTFRAYQALAKEFGTR